MGMCISKPYANDYATYSRDAAGEVVINRNLVGVDPGEDIRPRLARLDRKAMNQMMQGTLPYQDFDAARAHQRQQAFQPSAPAAASSPLPDQIKFFRNDSEGYLIETTQLNPDREAVNMARQQKAEMIRRLGPQGYANLRPQAHETVSGFDLNF